jgi:hypothetical protein
MKLFRDKLIGERPFRVFQVYCEECEKSLVEVSDLTNSPAKNEALILYKIDEHAKTERHYSFGTHIQPKSTLRHIESQITVNENL